MHVLYLSVCSSMCFYQKSVRYTPILFECAYVSV